MEEVYASLVLHASGKPVTVENLTKVLQSADITPDEGKLKALVASLEGVNIDQLLEQASVAAPAAKVEEKKEEKKEDEGKAAETASAGLSALFG
jgi:large subunit ribosomal protein L12